MAKGFSIELETTPLPLKIWPRAACPTGKKISFCPGSGMLGDTHEVSLHPEVIMQHSHPTQRRGRCSDAATGLSVIRLGMIMVTCTPTLPLCTGHVGCHG